MDTWTVICIISVAFTGFTAGTGVLPDGPLIVAVGGSVRFNTTVPPTTKPFFAVTWTLIIEGEEIAIITATTINVTNSNFKDRITLFTQTGSLELSKLALNDSGGYKVLIITDGGNQLTGTTTLRTLVPVSNVTLKVNSTDLVEFNSTVHLSCSSFGSSPSFQWLNGSTVILEGDTVQLTDGNATLILAPVTRYDNGSFKCRVSNAINEATSEPVHLSVSYGPDSVQIMGQSQINVKQTLTLICFADSVPLANYIWTSPNQTKLHNSSTLVKTNVYFSDSGSYICSASNNITGKTVSAVHMLNVTDEPVNPCSGGCIAGILVACLIVCAAVSGGGYYIYHNRKQIKNNPSKNTSTRTDFSAGDEVQETTAEIKDEDTNYSKLGQFYLMDNGRVQLKVQDKHTEYAEIKVSNGPPSYEAHVQRMKSRTHQQLKANEAQVSAPVHSNQS
ncbi:cell adhesion molecule CEACAM8-like [Stigmatopora argus]